MEFLKKQNGSSTVEIVIAFFILALSLTGVSLVAFGNQSISVDTELNQEALQKAQAGLEYARAKAFEDFDSVNTEVYGGAQITSQPLSQNEKYITSSVSWQTDSRNQESKLSTLLANYQEINALGGPGAGGNGNKQNDPVLAGCPNVKNISYLNTSVNFESDGATGLDVVDTKVYMTLSPANSSGRDFVVIDASNPSEKTPNVISSNTFTTDSGGLNAVDVSLPHAYAAGTNGSKQLQIIDVSDPLNLSIVNSFGLPGNSAPAYSIFYRDNIVYIGTGEDSGGPELYMVDVENPSAPQIVGTYEAGFKINKIYVRGQRIYLALENSPNPILVIDSETRNKVGEFSPGSVMTVNSLYFLNNLVYAAIGNSIYVLEFSAFSAEVLSISDSGSLLNDLVVVNTTAYIGTSDPNKFLQMWDVSETESPAYCASSEGIYSLTGPVVEIIFQNNIIYSALSSDLPLRVIELE